MPHTDLLTEFFLIIKFFHLRRLSVEILVLTVITVVKQLHNSSWVYKEQVKKAFV